MTLQDKFIKKENLSFPLLADPEAKVTKAFGVLSPKGFARRSTFIINKEGTVVKTYPNVGSAGNHPQDVLDYVKTKLSAK